MESDYHNPYDHHLVGTGDGSRTGGLPDGMSGGSGLMGVNLNGNDHHMQNHNEAPSCLVRNPSGSLFIPSSSGKIHP